MTQAQANTNLESLLGSDPSINVVELYVLPPTTTIADQANAMFCIGWDGAESSILNAFSRFPKQVTESKDYHYRDMVYSFDLASDQQRHVSWHLKNERLPERQSRVPFYATCYFEEVLPPHSFPCTIESTEITHVIKTAYKINNRMHLIHETNADGVSQNLYIRYQHSPNVDMTKMQTDLDRVIQIIDRNYPRKGGA